MFELRVITGLHQGAVLPLIGNEWAIGSTDEMDLCLFDSGLGDANALLSLSNQNATDQIWLLAISGGQIKDLEGHNYGESFSPLMDVPFQLGDIWLVISHTDTPWGDSLPLELTTKSEEPKIASCGGDIENNNEVSTKLDSKGSNNIETREMMSIDAEQRVLGYRNKILVLAGIFTAVVASSVLALGVITEADTPSDKTSPEIAQIDNNNKFDYRKHLSTPEDVKTVLKKMLAQRELLEIEIEIEPTDPKVRLTGAVDEHIQARFKRMLNRFKTAYLTQVDIVDEVVLKRHTLPFEIVQIHAGDNGHIVTSAGQQLFVGDEVNGIRLLSIANNRIEFGGTQAFAVVW